MADSTRIRMSVRGSSVVTVSLDDTLTISGKAADAKAVGDALALKVDADSIMEDVTITVDGQQSDNQGVILLYGDDIPIDDTNNAPTVKAAIQTVDAKTAADINYAIGVSVKSKIDSVASDVATVGAKTANEIIYADTTTIKSKVDGIEATLGTVQTDAGSAVKVTSQTLTESEKLQARTNISAVSSAEAVLVDAQNLTTSQQAQARTNIAALGSSDVADVVRVSEQTLTTAQQAQARANIGITSETPASETVALDSGLSATFTKCGKVCSMSVSGQLTSGVAQWASLGTIPATYIPYADYTAANIANFDGYILIHPSGTIQAGYTLAANAWVIVNLTYICV